MRHAVAEEFACRPTGPLADDTVRTNPRDATKNLGKCVTWVGTKKLGTKRVETTSG